MTKCDIMWNIFKTICVDGSSFQDLDFYKQCIITLNPSGIPLIPFCYLSSEQKCLRRSVSSAVWDGIRPDFSIYPPPSPSSTSFTPPPPNLLLPFHDDRKPSGAWRTPSQLTLSRGNFLSNMWRLWFKCTSKELWSFPRLSFLSLIKTMTVKSVNHQMYDNHFPQAHYCSARERRTGFIIMFPPFLQLRGFSTIPFTFTKVKHIHEVIWTRIRRGYKTCLHMIVCPGKAAIYIINYFVEKPWEIFTMTLCKTGNYGCNDPYSVWRVIHTEEVEQSLYDVGLQHLLC